MSNQSTNYVNGSTPLMSTQEAMAILSAALQPQSAGQITREGWVNINTAFRQVTEDVYRASFAQQYLSELNQALEDKDKLRAQLALVDVKNDVEALLREALKTANDMCRSLSAVVERKGNQTNWADLQKTLDESLVKQHEIMLQIGGFFDHVRITSPDAPRCKKCGEVMDRKSAKVWECAPCKWCCTDAYLQEKEPESTPAPAALGSATGSVLPLILASLLLLLPSCMHYSETTPGGAKTTFTAFATDADGINAGNLHIDKMTQSTGVEKVSSGIWAIVKTQVTGKLVNAGIDAAKSATNNAIDAVAQ